MESMQLLIKPLVFLVIVLLFYFCCIRSIRKMLRPQRTKNSPPILPSGEEEDLRLPKKKMSDQELIARLSASDPERAKELIKKWIKEKEDG